MMPSRVPLDFTKIESLRKHMLLTVTDMAKVLGVTRATYYAWIGGKPLRVKNDEHVRVMLKRLLAIMTDQGWPMPEVIAAPQAVRFEKLRELLNRR